MLLQPESAIATWRQWSAGLTTRPVIVGPLHGGRSNHSYLLDSNGKKLVLRINAINHNLPGVQRQDEIAIWQAASKQGIAPPLYFADKSAAYLVSSYIESDLPPKPQLDHTLVRQAIALLARCHMLDVSAPMIDYTSHIDGYWNLIDSAARLRNQALPGQREAMQMVLEEINNSAVPTGLCHHDPVVANFVGTTRKLYLVDWEYAGTGYPLMDYAALSVEWGIDHAIMASRTGYDAQLLALAESLYVYICALWEETTNS